MLLKVSEYESLASDAGFIQMSMTIHPEYPIWKKLGRMYRCHVWMVPRMV